MPAKKKEEPKQLVEFPSIFRVVAADLSLRRPGFAKFLVTRRDNVYYLSHIEMISLDNKKAYKKKAPEILCEISRLMSSFYPTSPFMCPVFPVRERGLDAISKAATTIEILSKVIGINDAFVWNRYHMLSYEIPPYTVKRLITGNYKAEKEQVAECLYSYVGEQNYTCDDESDALAVGISFMIENGAYPQFKDIPKDKVKICLPE